MPNNYRLTSPSDRAAFYQLYQYAFNKPDSPERRAFFMARYHHGWIYGLHADHQLVSGLYSLPFEVNFHGTTYRMNGIGDVMSAPEFAGHGGAGKLLTAALTEMATAGVTLSYLAPFSYAYYRRFGYEHVFNRTHQVIASRDLPRIRPLAADGRIRRYGTEGLRLSASFYQAQPQNQRGGLIRPDWWWDYLALKHPDWRVAIYQDAEAQIGGYLIYSCQPTTFAIHEWATNSAAAFTALANFVTKHGSTFAQFSYDAPTDGNGLDLLADPDRMQVTTTPYMMARIVDLHDFIKRYPFQAAVAPIRLAITDPLLPANQGCWELQSQAGTVSFNRLTPTVDGPADLQLTIQQLTKACFGTRSLTSALMHGQLTGSLAAAQRLDASLVATAPAFNDYF
ncbi:GNAT family N-acetyltransferase [Lactiplantibacillus modestisalitolerans]|uniref:Enhanced intracellular survival protein Eis n=1 Tax=Lactiplantibacillus modestisalitolerans TaxID=1457219 RepID=A0ABV5WXL1_9LACO|nr:GNAT family N-acetyltransferase [Lactiplantibacillus modestisalitolerans]